MFLSTLNMIETRMRHSVHVEVVTDRGDEQVSDLLAVIPLGHTGRQSDLEHGVALMDFLQTVKYLTHLLGV